MSMVVSSRKGWLMLPPDGFWGPERMRQKQPLRCAKASSCLERTAVSGSSVCPVIDFRMSVYVPLLFNLVWNQWNPEASHQRHLPWFSPQHLSSQKICCYFVVNFLIQFCSVFLWEAWLLRALRIEMEAEIAEEQRQLEEKNKRKQKTKEEKEKQKGQQEKEKLTPHACN